MEQLQVMENISRGFNWARGTPSAANNRFLNTRDKYPLVTAFNKTMDPNIFLFKSNPSIKG